ncbi:hypothetical protein C8F04DRAFT_1050431, partial [Mycena alexandri]
MYGPPPPPPQYVQHPHPDQHRHDRHQPPQHGYAPPYAAYVLYLPGSSSLRPYRGGGAGQGPGAQALHTDDAPAELSVRVRRRCFNCYTTDTSTWRRSNLSPGKVLCKCGLFELTYSLPRPEQFPHKRGPLAASILRARSPGQGQAQQYPQQSACYQPYPPPN